MFVPPLALLAVWMLWTLQALVSVLRVRAYVSLLGRGESIDDRAYRPKATVILPVKGIDPELAKCLSALLHQDYPDYRVVVVAESADDPACQMVASAIDEAPANRATLLVAGHAPSNQGQKVHNQLAAIETIEPGADDDEVWAFIDSDVVPDRSWLANIVGPLRRKERNAVCTGYRWMVPRPTGNCARPTVWAQLVSVMNASLAGLQGIPDWSLAWGGSMAMRVGTARKGDLAARWRGALTDDFPVTHMAEALGMRVHFVPRCMLVTPTSGNFTGLANFVALLAKVQEVVKMYPNAHFTIEGHTDTLGDPSSNVTLSEKRSYAVMQYLRQSMLLPMDHVKSIGYGADHPVASNTTTDGRAKNRRIDIVIMQ